MKKTRRVTLPKQLARVQAEAERAISRGYKATLELLPSGPRKAVRGFASQLEATADELTARGQKALKAAAKRRKALVGQLEKAVKAVGRRGERALATVETQRKEFVATVEQAAADVVRPLARRLDLAALSDVEQLGRRLAQVERKLTNGTRRAAA